MLIFHNNFTMLNFFFIGISQLKKTFWLCIISNMK